MIIVMNILVPVRKNILIQSTKDCMQIKSEPNIPLCTSKYYVDLKGICMKYDFKRVGFNNEIHHLPVKKIRREVSVQ